MNDQLKALTHEERRRASQLCGDLNGVVQQLRAMGLDVFIQVPGEGSLALGGGAFTIGYVERKS